MEKQQLMQSLLEQTRRDVITNVVQQYTSEAEYNYGQYIKSVHAAAVGFEVQADKIREEMNAEIQYTSSAIENWLRSKYGKINLF